MGLRRPRIFLLKPPVQGLLLREPDPRGERGRSVRWWGSGQGSGEKGQNSAVSPSGQWQESQNCQLWGMERAGRCEGVGSVGEQAISVNPWGRGVLCH